jgi:hypothetical protein
MYLTGKTHRVTVARVALENSSALAWPGTNGGTELLTQKYMTPRGSAARKSAKSMNGRQKEVRKTMVM